MLMRVKVFVSAVADPMISGRQRFGYDLRPRLHGVGGVQ
jgi:hypothetical protein